MTTRIRLFFAVAILALALVLMACPLSSTLMLTDDEMVGVMQGEPWPEGK